MAEDVKAAASEASEWDSGEREERLADLREEEAQGGRTVFILSCIHSLFSLFPSLFSYFLCYFPHRILLAEVGGGQLRRPSVKMLMYTSQS